MRGFGAVQACFALRGADGQLAAALGLDSVELRLLNALAPGDELPTGEIITGTLPVADVIRRCAELQPPAGDGPARHRACATPAAPATPRRARAWRRGVGFAVGFKNIGYSEGFDDYAAARVRLTSDGVDLLAEVHFAGAEVGRA